MKNPCLGYEENFSILIIPVIRNIGYGEPGEYSVSRVSYENNFGGWIYSIDQIKEGYGYAVSPRLEFKDNNDIGTFLTPDIDKYQNALN